MAVTCLTWLLLASLVRDANMIHPFEVEVVVLVVKVGTSIAVSRTGPDHDQLRYLTRYYNLPFQPYNG